MEFSAVVQDIESLPPLSNATTLVQGLYANGIENVNIAKLVRIIESDALLTVNILKMINAPVYGFSKKITSIPQAVSLFGAEIIYVLVMSYSIIEVLKADTTTYALTSDEFNEMCLLQSALMLQWYSKIDLKHAQFIAPLALIMEVGKLVLAREIEDSNYTREFKKGLRKCEIIEEYEHSLVGTTSYFLGGLLFEHWNFSSIYVDILKGLDYEEEYEPKLELYIDSLHVIRTAINVKEVLTDSSIEKACELVEEIGLDKEHFRQTALKIKQQNAKS